MILYKEGVVKIISYKKDLDLWIFVLGIKLVRLVLCIERVVKVVVWILVVR